MHESSYWARIIPPRGETEVIAGATHMVGALAEPIELSRVDEPHITTWWVSARTPEALERAIRRIRTGYPAAEIVYEDRVPGVVHAGEQGVLITLRPRRDPIITWEGRADNDGQSVATPLTAAARDEVAGGPDGSRIVERVVIRPADRGEPQRVRARVEQPRAESAAALPSSLDIVTDWIAWAVVLAAGIPLLAGSGIVLGFWQFGDVLGVAAMIATAAGREGAFLLAVLAVGAWLIWRLRRLPQLPAEQVRAKLGYPLMSVRVSYLVIGPKDADAQQLRALGLRMAEHLARMAGGALRPHYAGTVVGSAPPAGIGSTQR